MKSNEFITEAKVKPYEKYEIDVTPMINTLKQFCSDSLKMINKPIWRGMNNVEEPAVYIDPSKGVRKSENTTNHYTELIDHSPYFKGWPKRSRSLICTTNFEMADHYGSPYAIFPVNGVKIAVCPSTDMWNTMIVNPFTGERISVDDLNYFLTRRGLPDNYAGMLKTVKTPTFKKALTWLGNPLKPNQVIPALQKALSPQAAKFKLKTISEFAALALKDHRHREVWIGGPVIAIRPEVLAAVRKKIK